MPFPTSTILLLPWFFLDCFVLSPYKLLLRVSVNSFQVLVFRHPAVPVQLLLSFPQADCFTSPWGSTLGALQTDCYS